MIEKKFTYLKLANRTELEPAPSRSRLREINPSHDRDVAAVKRVHDLFARDHHWSSLAWSEADWRQWLSIPSMVTYLVEDGGIIIGLGILRLEEDGDIELRMFGIVPDVQGNGLGRDVLIEILHTARTIERNTSYEASLGSAYDGVRHPEIWLRTSTWDHSRALPNYLRRGFDVVPERSFEAAAHGSPISDDSRS